MLNMFNISFLFEVEYFTMTDFIMRAKKINGEDANFPWKEDPCCNTLSLGPAGRGAAGEGVLAGVAPTLLHTPNCPSGPLQSGNRALFTSLCICPRLTLWNEKHINYLL